MGEVYRLGESITKLMSVEKNVTAKQVNTLGLGVFSLAKVFRVHESAWKKNLSSLTALLSERYSNHSEFDIPSFQRDVSAISDKNGLGIKAVIVNLIDEEKALPNMNMPIYSGKMVIMAANEPVKVSKMKVFYEGEERSEGVVNLTPRSALVNEGKAAVQVTQVVLDDSTEVKVVMIKGEGNAKGLAIEDALFLCDYAMESDKGKKISKARIPAELAELDEAVDAVIAAQNKSAQDLIDANETGTAEIFDGQQLCLIGNLNGDKVTADPATIFPTLKRMITEQSLSINMAINILLKEKLEKIGDIEGSKAERDEKDLGIHMEEQHIEVLKDLLRKHNGEDQMIQRVVESLVNPVVLVCDSITPTQAGEFDREKISGVVLGKAKKNDHAPIKLSAHKIPLVFNVNVEQLKKEINAKPGSKIIVDSNDGKIFISSDNKVFDKYGKIKETYFKLQRKLITENKNSVTMTADEKEIHLCCNADEPQEVMSVYESGAVHGVGLSRSEAIFILRFGKPRNSEPSEDEQKKHYVEMAGAVDTNAKLISKDKDFVSIKREAASEMIIRTLDISVDKLISWLDLSKIDLTELKSRGLSLCLTNPVIREVFKRQIRAILLASGKKNNIKMMFPMVDSLAQFKEAKELVKSVMAEFDREIKEGAKDISYNKNIKIGAMIETKEGVADIDGISKEADFISIGTNDLTESVTGYSRHTGGDENIGYDEFDPRVLSSLSRVIEYGKKNGKEVSVCGEMAGNPMATFILLSMGLEKFSIGAGSMDMIKYIIRHTYMSDIAELKNDITILKSPAEVRKFVSSFILERMRDGRMRSLDKIPEFEALLKQSLESEKKIAEAEDAIMESAEGTDPDAVSIYSAKVLFNKGIHLRVGVALYKLAMKFKNCDIELIGKDMFEQLRNVNVRDMTDLMTLASLKGTDVRFEAKGPDAAKLLDAIKEMFEDPKNLDM